MKESSRQNVHAYGTLERPFSLKEKVLNTWRKWQHFFRLWTEYRLKICRDGGSIIPSPYLTATNKLGRCFVIISSYGWKKSKNRKFWKSVLVLHLVEIEQYNEIGSCLLIEYRSLCYPLAFKWVSCSYTPWLWRASSVSGGGRHFGRFCADSGYERV